MKTDHPNLAKNFLPQACTDVGFCSVLLNMLLLLFGHYILVLEYKSSYLTCRLTTFWMRFSLLESFKSQAKNQWLGLLLLRYFFIMIPMCAQLCPIITKVIQVSIGSA